LGSLVRRSQRGHLPGACDCLKGRYRHESTKLQQRGTTATDCSLGGSHVRKASPPGGWCPLEHAPREAGTSILRGLRLGQTKPQLMCSSIGSRPAPMRRLEATRGPPPTGMTTVLKKTPQRCTKVGGLHKQFSTTVSFRLLKYN